MADRRDQLSYYTTDVRQFEYPHRIPALVENPRRLDIDDVERVRRYKRLYGGCLCDALWMTGIVDTVLDHGIKPLRDGDVIAGRALPVKWHSVAPETHLTDEEKKERELRWQREGSPQRQMHAAVFPGCVMVFDTGGDMQAAQFGEMSCTLARSRGCVGVVNSGMTRDSKYIRQMEDFAYFSRGTTPNAYGGWRVLEVNVPIHIRGHLTHYVVVNPGDFIFGDSDGLQVIPRDYVDEVLLKGEEILKFEDKERQMIRNGMPIDQVYKQFGDL